MRGVNGMFVAEGLAYGLELTPVGYNSPAVAIHLRYDPGEPKEVLDATCPNHQYTETTKNWTNIYRSMHAYEQTEGAITAKVQVVNAGSFTGWVYHHSNQHYVVEDSRIDIAHTPESSAVVQI